MSAIRENLYPQYFNQNINNGGYEPLLEMLYTATGEKVN